MSRKKRRPIEARQNRHVNHSTPLPHLSEDELYARVESQDNPLLLVLDGVEDPHNLGACLRSADGAGVVAVIAPNRRAASVTETVRRISAGGAEHVPFVQVANLARAMERLKDLGVQFLGTSDRATQLLYNTDLSGPLAIVMGSEEKGMRRLTTDKCDTLVSIPMAGSVECLNVSVATAVCLFEAVRQRR
ncbi:MAG: 23S rRNA (guanosine(2251)-2'-O)-methyltransferase RlmB [Phycisphaerales bacterium]|jgi:23S rRNA (guanosine2251-2'-O)-methyltransferase|nr:23S rRNA (guanosine(2251)-2'-O)-methyltransferase RlmB [Phycisphaerales bacterium]